MRLSGSGVRYAEREWPKVVESRRPHWPKLANARSFRYGSLMQCDIDGRSTTLAHISRWKCGFGAVPVLALGIVPNLPGFGDGLTRYAFFYTAPFGVAVRLIACGALVLLGMILLLGVFLTLITSSKAVWLDAGDLKWGRIGTKQMRLTDLHAVSFDSTLNRVRLDRRDGGKPEYISTLGLRSADAPRPLIEKLRQLIPSG